MVNVIKVCGRKNSTSAKQIRRVAVSSDITSSFNLLEKKIKDLFPIFAGKDIHIKWKDSDNDLIYMSTDEELAQAVASMEDGLLRLFVVVDDSSEETPPSNNCKLDHPNVICDGCNKSINGNRYKCLQCKNFDLCSVCNNSDKHPEHDFIKLVKPALIPREWVFLGSRKLWKSMFHPFKNFTFHQDATNKKASFPEDNAESDDTGSILTLLSNNEVVNKFFHCLQDLDIFNVKDCENKSGPSSQKAKLNSKASPEKKPEVNNFMAPSTSNDVKFTQLSENEKIDSKQDKYVDKKGVEKEPKMCIPVAGECFDNCKDSLQNGPHLGDETVSSNSSSKGTAFNGECSISSNDEKQVSSSNTPQSETNTSIYPFLEQHYNHEEEEKPLDPQIASAVKVMKSMGFSNENRWLENLLLSKKGNINDALDALYPSIN